MNKRLLRAETPRAYLFMIQAGPTYAAENLEPLCRVLSQEFTGELWSYGSYEADVELGRIRLRVVKDWSSLPALNFINFARRVARRAFELRTSRQGQIVVTSYDPFKGGLLALWAARLLHAVFVCEVNGVYGEPDNFAHIGFVPWRKFRLLQTYLLGSFVLRRADAVRLLFAGQLKKFVSLRPRTLVRQFFAFTHTDRFYPGAEEPIILAAGFPFKIKGVDVLIKAFQQIAAKYPTWRLVLIGHEIPQELSVRGIDSPQIVALPGLLQSELAEWTSRCAVLALVSRSEAMGRVLLEGAAAGKCRIATKVGGIPTIVEDGIDGILVQKENVGELAAALERLINDTALRQRLGSAAKLRVEQHFSASAYLAHFGELIDSALQAFAPAPKPIP